MRTETALLTAKSMWAIWETTVTRLNWSVHLGTMAPYAAYGWPGTPLGLPLWSLKTPVMQQTPCVNLMAERSAGAESEWNCPMERSALGTGARPLRGAADLGRTTGGAVHPPEGDLHVGGASVAVAADLPPETGGGTGPSLVTGTTNLHAHSPGLAVVPGLMTGSKKNPNALSKELCWSYFKISMDSELFFKKMSLLTAFFPRDVHGNIFQLYTSL